MPLVLILCIRAWRNLHSKNMQSKRRTEGWSGIQGFELERLMAGQKAGEALQQRLSHLLWSGGRFSGRGQVSDFVLCRSLLKVKCFCQWTVVACAHKSAYLLYLGLPEFSLNRKRAMREVGLSTLGVLRNVAMEVGSKLGARALIDGCSCLYRSNILRTGKTWAKTLLLMYFRQYINLLLLWKSLLVPNITQLLHIT